VTVRSTSIACCVVSQTLLVWAGNRRERAGSYWLKLPAAGQQGLLGADGQDGILLSDQHLIIGPSAVGMLSDLGELQTCCKGSIVLAIKVLDETCLLCLSVLGCHRGGIGNFDGHIT